MTPSVVANGCEQPVPSKHVIPTVGRNLARSVVPGGSDKAYAGEGSFPIERKVRRSAE